MKQRKCLQNELTEYKTKKGLFYTTLKNVERLLYVTTICVENLNNTVIKKSLEK